MSEVCLGYIPNIKTRLRRAVCLDVSVMTPKQHHRGCLGVFRVNFNHNAIIAITKL